MELIEPILRFQEEAGLPVFEWEEFLFSHHLAPPSMGKNCVSFGHLRSTGLPVVIKYPKIPLIYLDSLTKELALNERQFFVEHHRALSPFIVRILGFIKPAQCIEAEGMVFEYLDVGDFFDYKARRLYIPEEEIKILFATLALVIDSIHKRNILLVDHKETNWLPNPDGFTIGSKKYPIPKLLDFEYAQKMNPKTGKIYLETVRGCPGYYHPKVLFLEPCGPEIDWWAWVVGIYSAIEWRGPFDVIYRTGMLRPRETSNKIINRKYHTTYNVASKEARDFFADSFSLKGEIQSLEDIKRKPFFENVPWDKLAYFLDLKKKEELAKEQLKKEGVCQ